MANYKSKSSLKELAEIKRDFLGPYNKMFGSFWDVPWTVDVKPVTFPSEPLYSETDTEHTYKYAVPGTKKEELTVEVEPSNTRLPHMLSVKLEKQTVDGEKHFCSSFHSTESLPHDVDLDNIKTSLKEGILTIIVPKMKPKATKSKKLKIE